MVNEDYGHDMNWNVKFNITIDGIEKDFSDLDDMTQEYLLEQIKEGYYSGTTAGAYLADEGVI